jgi:XXXCH domain-containing protein
MGAKRFHYKKLKKRMGKAFKKIRKSLSEKVIPANDLLTEFLADCEQMLSAPDKGEPHYPQVAEILARFRSAVASGKRKRISKAVDELDDARKACHKRYK